MHQAILFFLPLALTGVSASMHKNLAALPNPFLPRQACASTDVTCGFKCLTAGSDCCFGSSTHIEYCDPGTFCWGTANACCHPGDVACGVNCMPPGSECCDSTGHYCDPGEYCYVESGSQYCCPAGQTCTGTSTTYAAGETLTGPSDNTASAAATSPSTAPATTTPPTASMPTASLSMAPTGSVIPGTFTGLAVQTAAPLMAELPAVIAIMAGHMLL